MDDLKEPVKSKNPEKSPDFKKRKDARMGAYRKGVRAFVEVLKIEEEQGVLGDPDTFAITLKMALSNYNLTPHKLSEEESISRAAISKWMHGEAIPPAPTRKTVLNWIKRKLEEQLSPLAIV